MTQGWWSDDQTETTLVLDKPEDLSTGYIWEYHSDDMKKCAKEFLEAPIWEGKNFLQIEGEVTWTDW